VSDLPGAFASVLSALTTLPVWLLLGLAVAGWVVLFGPPLGDIDIAAFRHQWGSWVWVEAIAFSILFIARMGEGSVRAYWSHKATVADRRPLRFVQLDHECWWHLAKQQDDSYVSQIRTDILMSNTSHRPIKIVKAQLLRPRADLAQVTPLIPGRVSPEGGVHYDIPAHGTARASIHIMARGSLAHRRTPLSVTVKLTDQYGEEYKLRCFGIPTNDPTDPKPGLLQRAKIGIQFPAARHREAAVPERPVMPWVYDSAPESIGIADAILKEERRSYAANRRPKGGLGSLNAGLQSEPNYGATAQGNIPKLLWDAGKGTPLASPNLNRLLALHSSPDSFAKENVGCYLISRLDKEMPSADIAYFVFLALHRLNRTIDALTTARQFLCGDKVF